MAIDLTLKSVQITNREAAPRVLNSPQNGSEGVVHETFGHIDAVPAALSATSIIRLCQIPSNARVSGVTFYSGAQGAGAVDIGIYQTNDKGGAVVDADLFGSAVGVTTAVVGTSVLDESGQFSIPEMAMPLWRVLGLTADPHRAYDVAATVTTAVTTGLAPLAVRVQYAR